MTIKLRPSAASRWVKCPGSVRLPTLPQEALDSEAAREGTAFHWLCEELIESYRNTPSSVLLASDIVDKLAPNGVLITDTMYRFASDYFQILTKVPLSQLRVERHVDCSRIHPGIGGTPDAAWFDTEAGHLYIWDAKYGYGVVEPKENWQLMTYAAGLLDELAIDDHKNQHVSVTLAIYQPRAPHRDGPYRTWTVKACDLRPYFNRLTTAAETAGTENPPTATGSWCKYCPGRHACEAAQRGASDAFQYVSSLGDSSSTSGTTLAVELDMLQRAQELIKARLSGIEEQVKHELKTGQSVPGWGLKPTYGRRRWMKDIDQEEVLMMGDLMGLNLAKPRQLDTPAQVEKKGVDRAVIDAYSETPTTGTKLVAEDINLAQQVFGE